VRHWGLTTLALATAFVLGQPGPGGIVLGGGFIALSALLYGAGARALIRRPRPRLAIALLFVKLAAFLGLGWFVLASGRDHCPDPIGFVVGLTCFPMAAVWEAMRVRGS
jgi:hypothetical protein